MFNRSYIKKSKGHIHDLSDELLSSLKRSLTRVEEYEDNLILLRNLTDPTKLSIYLLLHDVEYITVTNIVRILDSNQSTVSHALSDLKKLGLVECTRCGQLMCYSLKKQTTQRNATLRQLKKVFS